MVINWYGEGCFKIQTGGTVLLVDPFEASTGLTPPRFKADIIIKTQVPLPLAEFFGEEQAESQVISGPGEYEVKGISIISTALASETNSEYLKSMCVVEAEGIKLGFFGHLTSLPEASELEHLIGVDIAFLPGGGEPYLNSEVAEKLVKQINPKIVVPGFFKISGLKRKSDGVEDFLRAIEAKKTVEPQEKLTIKKAELPAALEAVVLKI